MKLETLQKDKIIAMKEGNTFNKAILSEMIDMIQKASITPKGRIEVTEELVNEILQKYQKIIQEMIDTCPEDRVEKLNEYTKAMNIVKQYAPQLITDENEIKLMIKDVLNGEIELIKTNRGKIMKIIAPVLKGKVDMGIVNKVIGGMLQ